MKRKGRSWLWAVFAVGLVGGTVVFAIGRGQAQTAKVDPAMVVQAKRRDLSVDILEVGVVQPREKVELKSKVAGQVLSVFAKEGARTAKGDLLLSIDPTDFARDVARTEADLMRAQSALDFAKLDQKRKTDGVRESIVPQMDADAARFEVKAKEADLRSAQVALGAAQDRLRYTKITSPIDGTVIQRAIEPGEVVTPGVQSTFDGKALLTVADLTTLVVKVELNQIDVAKIALAQEATMTLDALPGKTYTAKVTKIAPAAVKSQAKGIDVFPIEAELTNMDARVLPGMTADVRIHLEKRSNALSLPVSAIVREAGKAYVTRLLTKDGKGVTDLNVAKDANVEHRTERSEVLVGTRNDHEIEITSGLEEGACVVIEPPPANAERGTK